MLRESDNTTLYSFIPAGHLFDLDPVHNGLDPVTVVDRSFFAMLVQVYGAAGKQRKYPVEQSIPGMFGFFSFQFPELPEYQHGFPVRHIGHHVHLKANPGVLPQRPDLTAIIGLAINVFSVVGIGERNNVGLIAIVAGKAAEHLARQYIFHFHIVEFAEHKSVLYSKCIAGRMRLKMTSVSDASNDAHCHATGQRVSFVAEIKKIMYDDPNKKPHEIPPVKDPDIHPDAVPDLPVLPEEDPDVIPDEDPYETPPYEVPEPGEGP